jgi:hypothetical protein
MLRRSEDAPIDLACFRRGNASFLSQNGDGSICQRKEPEGGIVEWAVVNKRAIFTT